MTVLGMLEAYERSVRCVSWDQEEFSCPSTNTGGGTLATFATWMLLQRSTLYASETREWFMRATKLIRDPPDVEGQPSKVEQYEMLFFGDGAYRVTRSPATNRGMLTNSDVYSSGGANLWRLLGRYAEPGDPMRAATLSWRLGRARQHVALEPTSEEPWPGVIGVGAASEGVVDVEVRVDPERGGMPRVIRMHATRPGSYVYETLVVVEAVQVDGIWMPRVGIQASMYSKIVPNVDAPLSPDRQKDFELSRRLEGLPPDIVTPELKRWIDRLQIVEVLDRSRSIVIGPFSVFEPSETTFSPQIMVASNIRVNQPMTFDEMFRSLPPDADMFNGLTAERTTPAGIRASFDRVRAERSP
ncbi:MAG: hypothetical protein ACKVW3_02040 [Phycisphaerales bacterium]